MRAIAILCVLASPAAATRYYPAMHFELGVGLVERSLGGDLFSAAGRTPAGVDQSLSVTGRALGVDKPRFLDATLHYMIEPISHLAVGLAIGGMFDVGQAGVRGDPGWFGRARAGAHHAPQVGYVQAIGDHVELHAGIASGWERIGVPVVGFESHPCKGGRCYPTADVDRAFVELRATAIVNLRGFNLGAYAGGDVLPSGGFCAGGFVGFSSSSWPPRRRAKHAPIT
jgi:hypothetical protein